MTEFLAGQFDIAVIGAGHAGIEAALAAKGRAPGIARDFAAMQWAWLPAGVWPQAREEARAREFHGEYHIFASDIDPRAVAMARDNARRARMARHLAQGSFAVGQAHMPMLNADNLAGENDFPIQILFRQLLVVYHGQCPPQ